MKQICNKNQNLGLYQEDACKSNVKDQVIAKIKVNGSLCWKCKG